MSELIVAATQMACSWDRDANIANAERLVRAAAAKGARLILLQELFETPYFCKDVDYAHMQLARPVGENSAVHHFQSVARELGVVLPISVYERDNNALYNSLAMIDADGELLGVYRKSHIPDGPGYHEKFYFNPGDTGFPVWETQAGKVGAAICWDQWFPEVARILALKGADIICYPTAIGSEPHDPSLAHHAGPCGGQSDAGRRLEPDRPRNRQERRDRLLRLVLHRRHRRREDRRGEPHGRGGADGGVRP